MKIRISHIALLVLAASIFSTTLAAGNSQSEAKARYNSDRAACMSGQTNQDRATCLQEAGAAYKEDSKGRINNGAENYQQNDLARCEALPPVERNACVSRMSGQGTTEGNVMDGGIYRKIVTPE